MQVSVKMVVHAWVIICVYVPLVSMETAARLPVSCLYFQFMN